MQLGARQTTTLLGGAVLAQLIGLAASPLLTRLFSPDDFAALALFGAVLGVLGVVAGGRYELAVILPKEDGDAFGLLVLALLLASGVSALIGVVVFIAGDAIASRWQWHAAGRWLWLLPVAVPLSCALAALGGWVNRQSGYVALAGSRVAQAAVAAGLSLALGWWGAGEAGLVWASCAGLLVGCLWLALASLRAPGLPFARLTWQGLRALARRHADFPRVNLPHALLDATQAAVLLSLLGAGWGATALGLYALVLRIVRAPMAMVGSAMGQVFQQRAAQAHNEGRALRPLLLAQWRQMSWWLLPLALLAGTAPWWFEWLFGAAWREGGVYALILLPWLAMSFLVSPLSQLPLVLSRQRGALLWGLAYQAAMLVPVWVATLLQAGMRQALLLHSLCAALALAGYAGWLFRISTTVAARGPADHG
jgi:O-antigen/teichoic acid export membrane protein